jgi:hypothetical protein
MRRMRALCSKTREMRPQFDRVLEVPSIVTDLEPSCSECRGFAEPKNCVARINEPSGGRRWRGSPGTRRYGGEDPETHGARCRRRVGRIRCHQISRQANWQIGQLPSGVAPSGFEPLSPAPKASMLGHYTTGLRLTHRGAILKAPRNRCTQDTNGPT